MTDLPYAIERDDVANTASLLGLQDASTEAADIGLAMEIANHLNAMYPGWLWAVSANHDNGIVQVRNLNLSDKWGFVLKIRDLKNTWTIKREAMLAGGELLERFGQKPGPMRPEMLVSYIQTRLARPQL